MSLFLRCLLAFLPTALLPILSSSALAAPARAEPGMVRVRIETSAGAIVVALDGKRAPLTTLNFLKYVDDGRLEGTSFYRAARAKSDAHRGFIQGGIDTDFRRTIMPAIPLESTQKTGIHHLDGVISMARHELPNSATGNFSIFVGSAPFMDAAPGRPGYAAFGHVVSGMEVVKKILAMPSCCGKGPMFGQMIKAPVTIIHVVRLDGVAKPTTFVRPWLYMPRSAGSAKRK